MHMIECQIRVMNLALEDRIGQEISAKANIVTFMADDAGFLLNWLEAGKDGNTAYEKIMGKAAQQTVETRAVVFSVVWR